MDRVPAAFPGGRRLAVIVYVNIEHVPFGSASLAHAIYPGTLQFSPDVLNHGWRDYGNRVGLWRLMRAMDRYGFLGTVNLNSDVCREYPRIIEEGNRRGWEWCVQGDNNTSLQWSMTEAEERDFIHRQIGIVRAATGTRPKGWLSMCLAESHHTPDLLAEAGIEYVSNYAQRFVADHAIYAGDQRRARHSRQGRLGRGVWADDPRPVRRAV
jgi:peptidoglycan/xylan/chitin deacetylase (PgdA/CDA1 family)